MSKHAESLISLIHNRKARIAVIGMGYVGYPMAHLAASQGFKVTGIEVDENKVNQINQGISYIQDVPSEQVKPLVDSGKLSATTDYSVISDSHVVLITVPTPLSKSGDPDMGFVISALDSMKPNFHSEMLIVLESTTYPGTTEDMFVSSVKDSGFSIGEDIFVAFSPERIDPGNEKHNSKNTPKIVGGVSPIGTEVAVEFYTQIVDKVIPVSSSTAAEMVKLYENTFRAINIGLVNELAIICNLLDVDVWEIINAASSKPFGFMPFFPGPGLGGHCIPIDPSYLAWKMRMLQYKTRFIDLANEINTGMPEYVLNRIATLLNDRVKPINGSKIMLLGMAYKNDIDDLRESPALDLYGLLNRRGATVIFHDPYCPKVRFNGGYVDSTELTPEILKEQDLIVITTGHKKVNYEMVLEHANLVFDTRNITRDLKEKHIDKLNYL